MGEEFFDWKNMKTEGKNTGKTIWTNWLEAKIVFLQWIRVEDW
jgi:hypothetical protein